MERKHEKSKKKKPVWLKLLIGLGILILALGIVVAALGMGLLNRLNRDDQTVFGEDEDLIQAADPTPEPPAQTSGPETSPAPTPEPTLTPADQLPLADAYPQTQLTRDQLLTMDAQSANAAQYVHVLLIGVDRRGDSGNSSADTMMIATIDKQNGRLKLTSVLRDMLVEIPGVGRAKLNRAASAGGVELLLQTLNETFHMQLKNYVLVDFNMFVDVVDAIGGVTVGMSAEEISAANDCIAGLNKQTGVEYLWDGFIFAEAGNVKLTGKQALGYARIRHMDSDFVRTNRQFNVLKAVFAKFRGLSLDKQYALVYDLMPKVETNMSNSQIIAALVSALSVDTKGLLHSRVPGEGTYQSGKYERKSVLLTDLTANAWALHQFIFASAEEAQAAVVLTPGASLPPRTPTPTYAVMNPDGTVSYYFYDGTPVDGSLPGGEDFWGETTDPAQEEGSTGVWKPQLDG